MSLRGYQTQWKNFLLIDSNEIDITYHDAFGKLQSKKCLLAVFKEDTYNEKSVNNHEEVSIKHISL